MPRSLRRLILAATALGLVFGWATAAAAADLEVSEKAYFGCLHYNSLAAMAEAEAPLTRESVTAAVDTAMALCAPQFKTYFKALLKDTLVRNGWQAPHYGAVSRFESDAPVKIRDRFVDHYAAGL